MYFYFETDFYINKSHNGFDLFSSNTTADSEYRILR